MINITEEQLKEIVTQAHMAGQHNQTGCDPSYFEAETHWQKQVKNLGLFSVVFSEERAKVCRFCNNKKVYDVVFTKWYCPVCDNVRQT